MEAAAAQAQVWLKDDEYAAKIKDIAVRTPLRQREDKLVLSLGKIVSVSVIGFRDLIFLLRVTTDSRVYKAVTTLNRENIIFDSAQYDPWSSRWTMHATRLISLSVVKDADDPDKLQALVNEQLRKMHLTENSASWSEQNIISPAPINYPEPTNQQINNLYCNEKMEEEEEETNGTTHYFTNPFQL